MIKIHICTSKTSFYTKKTDGLNGKKKKAGVGIGDINFEGKYKFSWLHIYIMCNE